MLPRAFGLALVAALALAAPARADSWLDPELPFGHAASHPVKAGVAMGPDGTIVVARVAPDGDVEVRERPPGGPVGDTITLDPVTDPPQATSLQVMMGEYGTAAVLFDAGPARYAALRAPGGRWSRPEIVSLAGTRQAAVAPDGALWVVGDEPANDHQLGVSRMAPDGQTTLTALPAPGAGAEDVSPMLTAPSTGEAHVTFQRIINEAGDGACRRITINFAIDVPVRGEPYDLQPLATFRAAGVSTAGGGCDLHDGLVAQPPKLASDDDRADTVVYTALDERTFHATVLARHRERDGLWGQAELVTEQDVVADTLIGGRGLPAVTLRTGEGDSVATRSAGGEWTPPASLFGPDALASPVAARTGAGTVAFGWLEPGRVLGRVLGADGELSDRQTLSERTNATTLGAGGDDDGDAVVLYSHAEGDHFVLEFSGFDGAGPRITDFSAPWDGSAGQELPFAVQGFDVWSGSAVSATWDFGDGRTADGLAVAHRYDAAGDYTVEVAVRDAAGHVTRAGRDVAIAGAEPIPVPTIPPPDRHPPHLTHLAVEPRHPRANRAPALTLRTDMAGELRVTLKHRERTLQLHRLVRAGKVRVKLPRLAAGTWTLTAAEKGARARLRFSVRRAARRRP